MNIYVNQVGYLTNASKKAISTAPCNFQLIRTSDQHCVYDGVTTSFGMDSSAGESVYILDFSEVTAAGSYYLLSGVDFKSPVFSIGDHVYQDLKNDMLKALYYQRCGCALTEEYAGIYTHAACHTAPAVFLADYLSKTPNPVSFDMTGGWHDAGDFGRYTSPAAVAVAHLLYAYTLFPGGFWETINIPESGNGMPDVLNECLYEINWLFKMQAPDGGTYHKLTSFTHADFEMPEEDKLPFLIYPVSSMATADFAAMMALVSRVYAPFDKLLSEKAKNAAQKAYQWLVTHPYTGFHNPEGCNTGEYDDTSDQDERFWAAAELLVTDPEHSTLYLTDLLHYKAVMAHPDFGWTDTSALGMLAPLFDEQSPLSDSLRREWETALFAEADRLLSLQKESGYQLSMKPEDFVWGSNMVVCNRAMLFIAASLYMTQNPVTVTSTSVDTYKTAALDHLHYLLGRNALGISYVTGYGEHAYRNPHNRPTACDGIDDPMPGWVSGGPNKAPCDPAANKAIPDGTAAMKCYVDDVESYSTNEITIYWNSPAIFMAAYFDSSL